MFTRFPAQAPHSLIHPLLGHGHHASPRSPPAAQRWVRPARAPAAHGRRGSSRGVPAGCRGVLPASIRAPLKPPPLGARSSARRSSGPLHAELPATRVGAPIGFVTTQQARKPRTLHILPDGAQAARADRGLRLGAALHLWAIVADSAARLAPRRPFWFISAKLNSQRLTARLENTR
jgi:hypothetical protein